MEYRNIYGSFVGNHKGKCDRNVDKMSLSNMLLRRIFGGPGVIKLFSSLV